MKKILNILYSNNCTHGIAFFKRHIDEIKKSFDGKREISVTNYANLFDQEFGEETEAWDIDCEVRKEFDRKIVKQFDLVVHVRCSDRPIDKGIIIDPYKEAGVPSYTRDCDDSNLSEVWNGRTDHSWEKNFWIKDL